MLAALPDELLEEIFLRLPPDEPECLVRASLASKLWLGLLSGPSFRARYLNLHGAPPMLGFLHTRYIPSDDQEEDERAPNLVPTTRFRPRVPDGGWRDSRYAALDCRHGRALLEVESVKPGLLTVWDPITGRERELRMPAKYPTTADHGAAVLCAASRCDHRACHDGPFLVVFVDLWTSDGSSFARARVFSSETGQWSEPCSSLDLDGEALVVESVPPVLVEDALFFMFVYDEVENPGIIKYDLGSNCLSLIEAPVGGYVGVGAAILMAKEDGSLGFARVVGVTLYLWSMQVGSDGVTSWPDNPRVINLKNLLPLMYPTESPSLNGSVEKSDIIFVTMNLGVYEINLKSLQSKKLWKKETYFHSLIPYMSFYTPQQGRVRPCDASHLPSHLQHMVEHS